MRPSPKILSVGFPDRDSLLLGALDWAVNGGLFVPSLADEQFRLGDQLLVLATLLQDEPIAVAGRVVWIAGTEADHPGIGVEFIDPEESLRGRIETLLGDEAAPPDLPSLTC